MTGTPRIPARANVEGASIGPGRAAKMMLPQNIVANAASFFHLGQRRGSFRSLSDGCGTRMVSVPLYATRLSRGVTTSSSVLESLLIRSSVPASGASLFTSIIPYSILSHLTRYAVSNSHEGRKRSIRRTTAIDISPTLPLSHLTPSGLPCNPKHPVPTMLHMLVQL